MPRITTIHKIDNEWNEEWFFSTDHCQPDLGDDWVPVTQSNTTPEEVRERNKDYCIIGGSSKEIPNPNPLYDPKY